MSMPRLGRSLRVGVLLVLTACGRTETYLPPHADAGIDAGVDAGADAGIDAGFDAGCPEAGCSDSTREGFLDACRYPNIAGCSGAFSVPGVVNRSTRCERRDGNSSANPLGIGCSVEDLCADGWHVCRTPADVVRSSPDGCLAVAALPLFFVSAQSGTGCGVCAVGASLDSARCSGLSCAVGCMQTPFTTNDIFGCGGIGDLPDTATCSVLNRFGNNTCFQLGAPWSCPSELGADEANTVFKSLPGAGGALCCRD